MHPNALILSFAALASVAVSTKDRDNGPRCAEDEYYNTMMESKNRKSAVTDCAKWLGGTFTDPKEIPKYLKDCGRDKDEDRVSRVSAACYCIATSSVPTTLSSTTHVSTKPSSTTIITTSSRPRSHPPSSSGSLTGSTSRPQSTPSSSQHPPTSSTVQRSSTTLNTIQNPFTLSSPSSHQSLKPSSFTGTTSSAIRPQTTPTSHPNTDQTKTTKLQTTGSQSTNTQPTVNPSSSGLTANTQTLTPTKLSTVTASGSSITSVVPSQAATTSFTTSTIYTESIYTVTSCARGKPDCPAASTVLVTSTIAISTTICPVTETPRPSTPQPEQQHTTRWTTTTIYSTTTYTLTRCPPGATNCVVGNLPITTRVPVSTTVLHIGETPTQNGGSNKNHGKPDPASTTFTVVTVPTTIQTVMNGVTAQILTVVPVTSAVAVENSGGAVPTPSSAVDADSHAGTAQPPSSKAGSNSGSGAGPVAPSHPHASATDAPHDAAAWEPTEPSRSGLTFKPNLPAADVTTVKASTTSSRPPVVTAGAPGLVGSDGMRVAFLVFVMAALI